jgi:hypothetical protein
MPHIGSIVVANQVLTNKMFSNLENAGPLAFGVLVFFFF